MSDLTALAWPWFVRTFVAGGGLLLFAAFAVAIVRQPARRQQLALWAVRVALAIPLLTLAPAWWQIPSPIASAPAHVRAPSASGAPNPSAHQASATDESTTATAVLFFVPPSLEQVEGTSSSEPAPEKGQIPIAPSWSARSVILLVYGCLGAGFGLFWVGGQLAVLRKVRCGRPAPPRLTALFAEQAVWVPHSPRLLLVKGLRVPVCCGLMRQTVLLPENLALCFDDERLRWIFAHELAHLRRGDPWSSFWMGLAAIVYFPMPWFWWLKHQIALNQEYVADAAAAVLPTRVEDYAEFLLDLSRSVAGTRSPALVATGVLGRSSDLFRRIAMLLNSSRRVETHCPQRWSLMAAGAFVGLAVVISGMAFEQPIAAAPASADIKAADVNEGDKKDDGKNKDDARKNGRAKDDAKGQEQFLKRFPVPFDPANPDEFNKAMQKMLEETMKQMQQHGLGRPMVMIPGFPGVAQRPSRLGAMVEKPSPVLVEQLDLPKDQGLVLSDISAESAAAKAGMKANDILLELNGKAVPSDPQEFRKQLGDIKAKAPVDAVVLRKGKKETVKGLTLPEAQPEPPFGNFNIPRGIPMPNIQVPNVPIVPAVPQIRGDFGLPGGNVDSMEVTVTNDHFNIHSRRDGVDITISGSVTEGEPKVESVRIVDGTDTIKVDTLTRVPEKHRDAVQKLLKNVSFKKN